MKNKKRTLFFRLTYISLTILVIVLMGVLDPSIKDLPVALKRFNIWWLYACVGSLLMYWLTDALVLHDITAYMYKKEPLLHSLKVGIIGLYYGALTPFATGGQPMQVVYMHKNKIPVGISTCIVSIKFIIYELSLCSFYVIAMILRGGYFYNNKNQMFWLTTFGFILNLFIMFIIIFTIVNKKLVLNMGGGIINLLKKVKIVKNKEKALESFEKTIDDYHTATAYLSRYKLRALGSYFISTLNLAFFFTIPYFIYRAFGGAMFGLFDIITLQAFLYLAVSFFPTPGSAGAAEGGFYLFFSTIFINVPVYLAMLVWRFLTYYLLLMVGSILIVFEEILSLQRHRKEAGT